MPDTYHAIEARVSQAKDAYLQRSYPTITAAARAYDVPCGRLQRRVRGGNSKSTKPSHRALTEEQEQAVADYIGQLEGVETWARLPTIRDVANQMLKKARSDPSAETRIVGECWPRRFLARYPQLFECDRGAVVRVDTNGTIAKPSSSRNRGRMATPTPSDPGDVVERSRTEIREEAYSDPPIAPPSATASTSNQSDKTDLMEKIKRSYPEPLVFQPSSHHTHTFILLHGRGSNADDFSDELLKSRLSSRKTLQKHFPTMKFVFPTAKKRRATMYQRIPINQWFDNYSLDDPSQRDELQIEGLCETAAFVRAIIENEAKSVGYRNLILGGLSQGCAMGLHVLLSFEGEHEDKRASLGGFVGMSGWLPFRKDLDEILNPLDEDEDYEDPFLRDPDDATSVDQNPATRAVNVVREIMDLAPLTSPTPSCISTPVFLGHGTADEKIPVALGQQVVATLRDLRMQVWWRAYEGLGHWYKAPEEIDDIVAFLSEKVGVCVVGG